MSTHRIRQDKTCKNCRHVVEKRYCSNCGQENIETRQSFVRLVRHFAEDFTHYDNAFWRTIKYLLFHPGRLTIEFISGKRQSFVPPVKLYIFISFLTFFLLSVLSTPGNPSDEVIKITSSEPTSKNELGYNNLQEFDSIQNALPEEERHHAIVSYLARKWLKIREKHTIEEVRVELNRSIMGNLPKVLFIYMPVSALSVWVFHNRKRWFYFDHGIFTLHYFSFLLLTFSVLSIWIALSGYLGGVFSDLDALFIIGTLGWWFFYFFRSHRRFYGESKLISRLKCFALFFTNILFISIFLLGLFIYSLISIQ